MLSSASEITGQDRARIHFVLFALPGTSSQSWRHPAVPVDAMFDLDYFTRLAQTAKRGLFDALFFADSYGLIPDDHMPRYSSASVFEPLSLVSALAARTDEIGFIYTASTSLSDPFALARQVASLDHLSGGRAGWNAVTSRSPEIERNYAARLGERRIRYRKAGEFVEVVRGLWDTFEDEAFPKDREAARFYDPARMHRLDHRGDFFTVEGPLGIARPPQGHPVVAQAGASDEGLDFAATHAEVVFAASLTRDFAQSLYLDLKARVVARGRQAGELKILTGTTVIWGETDAEAQQKYEEISALFAEEGHLETIAAMIGLDPAQISPDVPITAAVGETIDNIYRGGGHQKALLDHARQRGLSLRQLARETAVTNKHRLVLGSTRTIADDLEQWISTAACDGFVFMSPFMLAGLEEFVTHVVPELQRRGLYPTAYDGPTLRDKLGLARPANRYARHGKDAAASLPPRPKGRTA